MSCAPRREASWCMVAFMCAWSAACCGAPRTCENALLAAGVTGAGVAATGENSDVVGDETGFV